MVVFLPDYFPSNNSDEVFSETLDAVGRYPGFLEDTARVQRVALLAHTQLLSHPLVDPLRIGVIGFCFGGSMALNMARAGGRADVVISLHGEYPAYGTVSRVAAMLCARDAACAAWSDALEWARVGRFRARRANGTSTTLWK